MRAKIGKEPGDMLRRLQGMLYEFHDMGRFEEARPHILWLMEIVERDGGSKPSQPTPG